MCGMENNTLSVAIDPSVSLISKQKERNYPCMVDGECQEIAFFSSAMLHQKNAALVSVHITLVIIYI